MEIKATCKFDLASVKALVRVQMFKKADPGKRMIFWSVIYGAIIAVLIWELIAFGPESKIIFMLGVLMLVLLLGCYLYYLLPKIQYKAMAKLQDAENVYTFGDETLKVFTNGGEYSGASEMEYSVLVRVYETSRYFFLYQTKNQAYIVDKSTVTGGSAEDIRNKLSVAVKNKYVHCNY